jgi:hypothetical protein
MRRHMILAAAPACALLVFSPFTARAADVIEVPAPPSSASAVALKLGSLLDVSKTGAVAHDTKKDPKPTAEASVLRLNEQVLLGLGGTQEGVGSKDGVLIDTGANNPIRVEVAPWATKVEETSPDTVHSRAEAALVKANVANVVKAALLHSESDATWTKGRSTGTAYSNGVELDIASISVVLLHSEVKSDGTGHSYLVGLNGNEIGTDSQLGNSELCSLDLSLLALSCLQASGGGATITPGTPSEAAAQVAQVDLGVDPLKIIDPVAAFTASSSSGIGSAPIVELPAIQAPGPALSAAEDTRSPDAIAPAAADLPRTGATFAGSLVFGLVALLGGALLRLTGRRRGTA